MAFAARLSWIDDAFLLLAQRPRPNPGKALIEEKAEVIARRMFDGKAYRIHPLADAIRRALYKMSLIKEFLEHYLRAGSNAPEQAHRKRLRFQTLVDFQKMMNDEDLPFPDVVY